MPNVRIKAWRGLFPMVSLPELGCSLQFLPVTKLQFAGTQPEWGRTPEELIQTEVSYAGALQWIRNLSDDATLPTEETWRTFATMAAKIPFTPELRTNLRQAGLATDAAMQLDYLLEKSNPTTLAQAMLLEHGTFEWVTRSLGPPLGVMGSPRQEICGHTTIPGSPAFEVSTDNGYQLIGFRPMVLRPVREFPI